jgi:hypothetical protein
LQISKSFRNASSPTAPVTDLSQKRLGAVRTALAQDSPRETRIAEGGDPKSCPETMFGTTRPLGATLPSLALCFRTDFPILLPIGLRARAPLRFRPAGPRRQDGRSGPAKAPRPPFGIVRSARSGYAAFRPVAS